MTEQLENYRVQLNFAEQKAKEVALLTARRQEMLNMCKELHLCSKEYKKDTLDHKKGTFCLESVENPDRTLCPFHQKEHNRNNEKDKASKKPQDVEDDLTERFERLKDLASEPNAKKQKT